MDVRQSVNAGARLDRLPISRLHWRILGLITAGATLDAFDIYLAGGVVAAMLKEGFDNFGFRGVLWMVIAMLAALSAAILTLRVETAKISLDDNVAIAGVNDHSSAVAHDQGI